MQPDLIVAADLLLRQYLRFQRGIDASVQPKFEFHIASISASGNPSETAGFINSAQAKGGGFTPPFAFPALKRPDAVPFVSPCLSLGKPACFPFLLCFQGFKGVVRDLQREIQLLIVHRVIHEMVMMVCKVHAALYALRSPSLVQAQRRIVRNPHIP